MIDRTDRRILSLLQADGRIAGVELAEKVGLSPTATGERLKRLTRDGYITGYRATLDPAKLGLHLLVFVEVYLDKTTPDAFERFAAAVKRAPLPRRGPAGPAGSARDTHLCRHGGGQDGRCAAALTGMSKVVAMLT